MVDGCMTLTLPFTRPDQAHPRSVAMDDGCMTLTSQGTIGRAVAPTPAASD